MITGKWMRSLNSEYGLQELLNDKVKSCLSKGRGNWLGNHYNDTMTVQRAVVHSFREIGTSMEMNVEVKWKSCICDSLDAVEFSVLVI